MRGIGLQIETLIAVVIVIALLVLGFLIVTGYIFPTQGGFGNIDAINRLCPDWIKIYSCSCDSAGDLKITLGSVEKTLLELCAKQLNGDVANWKSGSPSLCDRCKKYPLCGGCPS